VTPRGHHRMTAFERTAEGRLPKPFREPQRPMPNAVQDEPDREVGFCSIFSSMGPQLASDCNDINSECTTMEINQKSSAPRFCAKPEMPCLLLDGHPD
jgi:hypothetical protein